MTKVAREHPGDSQFSLVPHLRRATQSKQLANTFG